MESRQTPDVETKSFRRSVARSFRGQSRPTSSAGFSISTSNDVYLNSLPKWPRGLRPWVSLVGCFFLMFNSWGLVNAFGTFSSYYMQHLMPGQDLLRLGTIGGTECFFVLILSGVVGRLLDAGYYRYLIATGTGLVTVGMFSLAWSAGNGGWNQGNYPAIWTTQGLIMGLGMACFFVSSSQVAATWFVRRKATAIGIVASGASIAGLVYPVAVKFLIKAIGWNKAVMAVSGIVLATSLISVFCAHPNPEVQLRSPEKWLRVDTWVDLHAFKHRSFCWFVAAIAWMFLGFYAVFFNLEEWATVIGVGYRDSQTVDIHGQELTQTSLQSSSIRTFYLLGIMNGSSTIGRIGSAYLSDKFATPIVHMISTLTCSILILTVWLTAKSLPQTMVFVILFGSFSGAVIGLPPASMAWILGHTPAGRSKLGQWTGMMYTCAAVPSLIGPVIVGHLITRFDTFLTVHIWSGVCLLLSGLCMGIAAWYGTVAHPELATMSSSAFTSRAPTICITENGSSKEDLSEESRRAVCGTVGSRSPDEKSDDNPDDGNDKITLPVRPAGQNIRQTTLSFLHTPTPSQMRNSMV